MKSALLVALLLLAAVAALALLRRGTPPVAQPANTGQPEQAVTLPTVADLARLERQTEVVAALLRERYGEVALARSAADLAHLQRLLDDRVLASNQTYELQGLGIVLGHALAKELGLHWVTVEDEYGRDPALRYEETSIIFFPLTMISKRVERGEPVDVRRLVEQSRSHLTKLKADRGLGAFLGVLAPWQPVSFPLVFIAIG